MKLCLALCTILSVLTYSQAAVKSLKGRTQCLRGLHSRVYEDRIRELVEGLRDQLKDGIPDLNITALDPFVMDNLELKINEPFAKLDWNMTGQIDGLMGWKLTDIYFNDADFNFNGEILIREIVGGGTYKINGALVEVLPVYGTGVFDVLAKNLKVNVTGKIGSRGSGEDEELFLENFSVGASLVRFIFGVTGLMEDDQLSFLLSQMISENLPDLIESFQNQIDAVVSNKVTVLVDGVLEKMTTQDIIDILNPKPVDPNDFETHC